jgi:CHASE2 domain-containing sensor protein
LLTTLTRLSFDPRARLGPRARLRFLLEWAGVGCLGVVVILFASLGRLSERADELVYDRFLSLHAQPLLADIVVLEIDNASIEQLGRWPWPRTVHAKLLQRLAAAKPAVVIYDILFTESNPDDAELARAIALSPTYLPVLLTSLDQSGQRIVSEPAAPLARAAAGLGHINLEVDRDGIVRSVAQYEGDADTRYPQLMVSVDEAFERGTLSRAGETTARASARTTTTRSANKDESGERRFLIPFGPNADSYRKMSFAGVLAGDVPLDALRGRIVLVGATASGLYDRFATPVSGELGPLPGVYIHANVLDALLSGREIEPVGPRALFAASLVPLAWLLAGLLVFSPRRSLLLTGALGVLAAAASAALLYGARLWMSPVPALLGLVIVYPIWNWRRLEMTMAYLRGELERLASEPHLLPETRQPDRGFGGDLLEQHMTLMAQAAQRLQDMKRFVWDSIDSVPEPILVSDVHGVVLFTNQAAKAYFARLGAVSPEVRPMQAVLGGLTFVKTIDGNDAADGENDLLARARWPAPLDPARREFAALMAHGVEVRDAHAQDYLLRYANCLNEKG